MKAPDAHKAFLNKKDYNMAVSAKDTGTIGSRSGKGRLIDLSTNEPFLTRRRRVQCGCCCRCGILNCPTTVWHYQSVPPVPIPIPA